MKKIHLNIFVSLLIVSLGFTSCFQEDKIPAELIDGSIPTDDVTYGGTDVDKIDFSKDVTFDGFNVAMEKLNKNKILGQLITTQYYLRGGKGGTPGQVHDYQYKFSLETDNYAGYLCLPQDFAGRMKSTYYDSRDFNGGPMGSFLQLKNAIVPVLNHPQIDSIPEIKALGLLLYNYSAVEVADIYGAFPYEDWKVNKQDNPFEYNSAKDIYEKIFLNLDNIVACFDNFSNRPQWYRQKISNLVKQYDKVSNGKTLEDWKRLANSLKLRMAMHIVKIDPDNAKKWTEEAVASGVIETIDQEFKLSASALGFTHPLAEISGGWNDTRLNASFESMLASLKHPILEFLFDKNSNNIVNKDDNSQFLPTDTKVVGLRSGIRMLAGQSYDVNFRTAYSKINSRVISKVPLYVFKLSEVQFLRAEGALRGWNMGGTPQYFYEEGLKNAFKGSNMKKLDNNFNMIRFENLYSDLLTNYLSVETPVAYKYEDPYNDEYNMQSITKIGVKWNDGDDNETKLEKIITQKYIMLFPNSFEAWTEIRRTGYPKIFPVVYDDGDGSIPAGDIIRRIPFSDSDPATKADIQATGLKALGGADLQGTRVWWDVNKPNF